MIKVFNSTDTTFSTNGNVVLEPTYANVHKEDNGEYYLDIETNLQDEVIKHIEAQAGTTIDTTGTTLTDVDTTKENEFTYLKGDTSQTGTPTPNTPQPINVVSGDNTINIIKGNLITSVENGSFNYITGEELTNATRVRTSKIQVKPSTTYTTTSSKQLGECCVCYYQQDGTTVVQGEVLTTSNTSFKSATFTTPSNVYYVRVRYGGTPSYREDDGTTIILGESQNQTISLPIENMFNFSTITSVSPNGSTYSDGLITTSSVSLGTAHITTYFSSMGKPSGKYYISADVRLASGSGTWGRLNDGVNTFTEVNKPTLSNTFQRYVYEYTYSSNKTFDRFYFQVTNCNNAIIEIRNIQLSKINSSYTPYGTIPIELCKIGNYQDKIYKDNGIWYLHKEIGKYIFNGTENKWYTSGQGFKINGLNDSYNYPVSNSGYERYSSVGLYSNYGVSTNAGDVYATAGTNNVGLSSSLQSWGGTTDALYISKGSYSLNDFKSLLNTNNLIVYYVLATPTNTEITGNLKNQLEALDKLRLFEGTTNIMITPNDLNPILTVHYNYVTGGDVTTGDYLQPNNLLVCNTPTGNQAFRITNVEKTRHKIKIKANHVFYDSMNYVINDSYVVDKNLNDALDHLNNATDNTSPFTTTSNVNTINSFRCVRKSLYEAINVLLERWGGHLVRDNFDIKIMNSIGQDNGVTVRYAKNLKDITVDYNWDNVVTKILPVGYDGVTLDEVYLYSDTQYDIPYTKVVHFDQDIDIDQFRDGDGNVDEDAYTNALKADLRNQASTYLLENAIPKVNYELQANLEKITDVGDIIEVIDERLGINIMTSLIAFDYDPILNKYTYIQFGNFQKKLNDLTSYIEAQSSEVANEISTATKVTLQTELNQATSQLWGVLGNSYVIVEGDKILIVDTLPKENATNVIMLNSGGIGFSNTGINGTFTSAWTIDNKLNMENINVINLTADLIKGGTLKLGSNINQNGILEVYDEANNLIAQLNKDGLRMNATDGGYILINTTVGFSGYDRNDNRIYWVDGDEFHMKKSVVEEEITLVDKMRIIPITITDGNNNIVNDGIGWVSTL